MLLLSEFINLLLSILSLFIYTKCLVTFFFFSIGRFEMMYKRLGPWLEVFWETKKNVSKLNLIRFEGYSYL